MLCQGSVCPLLPYISQSCKQMPFSVLPCHISRSRHPHGSCIMEGHTLTYVREEQAFVSHIILAHIFISHMHTFLCSPLCCISMHPCVPHCVTRAHVLLTVSFKDTFLCLLPHKHTLMSLTMSCRHTWALQEGGPGA